MIFELQIRAIFKHNPNTYTVITEQYDTQGKAAEAGKNYIEQIRLTATKSRFYQRDSVMFDPQEIQFVW